MTAPAAPFGRVLTAMATAFTPTGELDLDAIARTALHLVDNGNDGIVVSGTTGESATTTVAEDGRTLAAVKDAVGDRAKVIAGVGTNDTPHSIELAEQAAKLGADGLLLVTPYYNKPSQAGIVHHFQQVVDATDVPVMLYDVPGRTGTRLAPSTYEAFADNDKVIAVKDATADVTNTVLLRSLGYDVYSGDDALTLGFLAYGACGVVSVLGHAAGTQLSAMIEAFLAGDLATAQQIDAKLRPALEAVMGVPNYGATTAKGALQALGVLDNRAVRSPLMALDDEEYAALRAGLVASGLL
ncbi:4-hydroxy-tetrahydrodipicolinate synthase [Nocardioides jiangxiensis]|uniref:4-hydroxy-tetrahydrodipicolinate synthase n=1 Tax=Nocardioides jiangxiensis TaxID=3064524 RepID=A0ABT9AYJ3_9ACTN|nr:4-hydroxy-tetrahydrodipicolinate synthase [Nocardioides sp. WY-20]MDO7866998.1 4-hydroxy-tetrahydrodipicolinate synthase [Nocardioides sp. WY-20]